MTHPYVWMKHPALPDNAAVETPRLAFENVYQHLGWVEAEADAGPTQADLDAVVAGDSVRTQAQPGEGVITERAARGKAGTSKVKE